MERINAIIENINIVKDVLLILISLTTLFFAWWFFINFYLRYKKIIKYEKKKKLNNEWLFWNKPVLNDGENYVTNQDLIDEPDIFERMEYENKELDKEVEKLKEEIKLLKKPSINK